jgi:hypothetical protein
MDYTVFLHEGVCILENYFTNKSMAAVYETLHFMHLIKEVAD